MYKAFIPSNYETFAEIETIDNDFILLAYGDATNKMRPSLIGTSMNKKILKILSYSITDDTFNAITYPQKNEIVHIIACDFLNTGESLSYILVCKNDNENITESTKKDARYVVSCFTPGSDNKVIEIGKCSKMPILYSENDWRNYLLLQNNEETAVYVYKDKLTKKIIEGFPNLALDHSSGFIDIDGDMKAELVLVTERNGKRFLTIMDDVNGNKEVRMKIKIPDQIGPIGFGDFNASGAFDIVFVSKESDSYYLNLLLNKRTSFANKEKRGKKFLKYTDHTKYTEDPFTITDHDYYHKIPLDMFGDLKPKMKADDRTLNGLPTGLLVADITVNSYPDIVLLMEDSSGKTYIRILENKFYNVDENQTFVPLKIYPSDMDDIFSVSIADIKKTGRECLVVNRIHSGEYSIGNIESNISKDSYKIHATTLRPGTKRGFYQSSVPGVSYKYYIEENDFVRIGHQMSQFSHLSFQTQTAFFGLGYTNFLVDKFFLSGPSRSSFNKVYLLHSKVIPNSELVLTPNQNSVITELYLSFAKNVMNIIIVFTIVLLLNFTLVVYTYKKEKDLEKKNKKRESYLFNFSAL